MRDLATHRLVYLAPRAGRGGVGDYADDFVAAVRPLFGEVVDRRHGEPGDDSVRDLARHAREVRRVVAEGPPGRVIVHSELSGGAVVPFWATRRVGPPTVPVTATVHDPPRLVWWPAATRTLVRHPVLKHGLHYPLRGATARLERRVAGERTFLTLSETGAAALAAELPRARVLAGHNPVTLRPEVTPATERPRAVGLFGIVYRGKGFEALEELRRRLPPDIVIRVAGRGTRESLPPMPGVEVLGAVEGADEDAFFASVRVLLVPYGPRVARYGDAVPASGTLARALAYRTPVVCSDHGALAEAGTDGAAVLAHDVAGIAAEAAALVDDPERLGRLAAEADWLARERTHAAAAAVLVAAWEAM